MEYVCGNIFIRLMNGPGPGWKRPSHSHNFDHTTFAWGGPIRVNKHAARGSSEIVDSMVMDPATGFNWALIEANTEHSLEALPWHVINEGKLRSELLSCGMRPELINKIIAKSTDSKAPVSACVYAHREPQGDVVQKYTGWRQAYE